MSKHYTQCKKLQRITTDRRIFKILTTIDQYPYHEMYFYLPGKERRKFKSWKNYRDHQYR